MGGWVSGEGEAEGESVSTSRLTAWPGIATQEGNVRARCVGGRRENRIFGFDHFSSRGFAEERRADGLTNASRQDVVHPSSADGTLAGSLPTFLSRHFVGSPQRATREHEEGCGASTIYENWGRRNGGGDESPTASEQQLNHRKKSSKLRSRASSIFAPISTRLPWALLTRQEERERERECDTMRDAERSRWLNLPRCN